MWSSFATFILGRPAERQIPTRIRTAILRQQAQAEILIGWTQFALFLFFLLLYLIAPTPSDAMAFKLVPGLAVRPVPLVVSVLLAFTLFRVVLAHLRIVPAWFLAGSVVIDIALLLLLIWSFHIQYSQPAAFYLKAPTLLYVFLLIALRALRFDPIYVVIAGVSAALGWAAMVLYALAEPSLSSLVTHDFVEYMTSNRILIGAEVDKILCILLVTAVLAVVIMRARRLLTQSVADATVARELTRFVAPEVASHVATAERAVEPGDGRVIKATILFCDIQGFSTIAEKMSPERLMHTLNAYFAAIAEVVEVHGGTIIAYQGMRCSSASTPPTPIRSTRRARCAVRLASSGW
ncbi:MAG: adenylate/guanylate cyclase domain-containing protein [Rhodospirillales bacterium]|nr:adenylate/guanylate cyclase domain-containing protein [Rhodospirillales bacterium]